jgi:HD superfamily phosphodiesterase
VARRAAAIGHVLNGQAGVVEAAAWLHDIGYSQPLVTSGFHPLDGARYLRDRGFGERPLWTLVAHHTCALVEAEERGVAGVLAAEFPIGPDGQPVDVDQRIAEILTRYPPDHVVHRSIARAAPRLRADVHQVTALVGTA